MRTFAAGVSLLLTLVQAGSSSAGSVTRANSSGKTAAKTESPTLRQLKIEAYQRFQAWELRLAAAAYEASSRQALREDNPGAAIRELNNLASLRLATFAYQDALRAYLDAKKLAQESGRLEVVPVLNANLSSLYSVMGDYRQAIELGEATLPSLNGPLVPYRVHLLTNLGMTYRSAGDLARGQSRLEQAAEQADRAADARLQAIAYDRLGYFALKRGELDSAEGYLFSAFRLRALLAKTDLHLSYPKIGELLAARGDFTAARRFYDLAVATEKADPKLLPFHEILASRAELRERTGDATGAIEDYRAAFTAVRRQRLEVLPIGSMQASWEGSLQTIRSRFIRFAAERAIQSGDTSLALEALLAAEESRAASVRSSGRIPRWQSKLPPEYWEKLAALQLTESAQKPDTASKLAKLRLEITELEARAGLEAGWLALPADPLRRLKEAQQSLPANEAVLSFHVDEPNSYLWTLTRNEVHVVRIAGRKSLTSAVREFRTAVEQNSEHHWTAGRELYSQLFGEIPPYLSTKSIWTMIADDRLFDLPFAALPASASRSGDVMKMYLIEKYALRSVPSVFLAGIGQASKNDAAKSDLFVGIADPVYNSADPRLNLANISNENRGGNGLELPRLVSSATEIRQCSRAWTGTSRLLTGTQVTTTTLAEAVASNPSVLHLATHYIPSRENSQRAMMALGLSGTTGKPQLLGVDQIASYRMNGGMVVMSGCHSGAGEAIPGAGLMGLTRSWLIAGATVVAGTYWPTPDDSGELFAKFYRHYGQSHTIESMSRAAAMALQQAQVEMIRSASWRREPRYWSAYFLVTGG